MANSRLGGEKKGGKINRRGKNGKEGGVARKEKCNTRLYFCGYLPFIWINEKVRKDKWNET